MPAGRILTPGPARHSLAPSLRAGPQGAAGKAAEEVDAAGVFVSGPAVSAALAGPSASDAAETRPWEPTGRLHFQFPPRGPSSGWRGRWVDNCASSEVLQAISLTLPLPAPCTGALPGILCPEVTIPLCSWIAEVTASRPPSLAPPLESLSGSAPFPLKGVSLRARGSAKRKAEAIIPLIIKVLSEEFV